MAAPKGTSEGATTLDTGGLPETGEIKQTCPRYNQVVDEITISISTCEETGVLVASWDDPGGSGGLATQADQFSDLERNIREAVAVHFEPGELPKHLRLHFVDDPVLAAA